MSKTEIINFLKEIITDIQDEQEVKEDTLLLDEGIIDSVSILYLISEIEDRYEIHVSLEDVNEKNFASIDAISTYVCKLKSEEE